MPHHPDPETLGAPDLAIAGLRLWVHGRERRDPSESHAAWLSITAHCTDLGASVWTGGTILQARDLLHWGLACASLEDGTATEAALAPLEPELQVHIARLDALGHCRMTVHISPRPEDQAHVFRFEIALGDLAGIVSGCRGVAGAWQGRP